MIILQEVTNLTHGYARTGGKKNRNQQRARMLAFAEFAAVEGAYALGQVGRRHVVEYWKQHRNLSPATLYSHWLAIRDLWKLAGKPQEPPRPLSMTKETKLKSAC